jgi:hypothetical protein
MPESLSVSHHLTHQLVERTHTAPKAVSTRRACFTAPGAILASARSSNSAKARCTLSALFTPTDVSEISTARRSPGRGARLM